MDREEFLDVYHFKITEEEEGQRIDVYLSNQVEELSRSHIQKLIEKENVLVNQKPVKPSYKLKEEDEIVLKIPLPENLKIEPENIPVDIVYEDEHLIVVNKPQGMVVHPAPGNFSGTLVNALLYHCKNLSGINGVFRPGIVHRIDKDTSGLLVVAKSDRAHLGLAEQIKNKNVTRKYIALVEGNIKDEKGTVNAPIGRHPVDRKKMAVVKNGKEAITHYRVLERFGEYTLIEATLETGRTHQIRVHMAYIGYPVVGDPVYGRKKQRFNIKGQMLHAKVLGFIHPITNEYMEFEAPLPNYFLKVLENLRKALKS